MRLFSAKPLVDEARRLRYAVPALNTNGATYEITRAALEAADEMRSPVIVQVYEPNSAFRGFDYFVHQVRFLMQELGVSVPVALQLDHGHSIDSVLRAMQAGITSVMIDASHEPLAENIQRTCQVLRLARDLGVSVEAEIGYVQGNDIPSEPQVGRVPVPPHPVTPPIKTDPDEAIEFARQTGVNMLAVSVGTTHGVFEEQSRLDFDLLDTLRQRLDVPLVQHGTCGISPENISRLARGGMAKINFGEPFRYNYIRYFVELVDEMEHRWHAWRIAREVMHRLKNDMKELIAACGADGKAP